MRCSFQISRLVTHPTLFDSTGRQPNAKGYMSIQMEISDPTAPSFQDAISYIILISEIGAFSAQRPSENSHTLEF